MADDMNGPGRRADGRLDREAGRLVFVTLAVCVLAICALIAAYLSIGGWVLTTGLASAALIGVGYLIAVTKPR